MNDERVLREIALFADRTDVVAGPEPAVPVAQPRPKARSFAGRAQMYEAGKEHPIHAFKATCRMAASRRYAFGGVAAGLSGDADIRARRAAACSGVAVAMAKTQPIANTSMTAPRTPSNRRPAGGATARSRPRPWRPW